jgi:energy-coupling factor transporter ATP-binding protein EcfA2
MHTFKNFKNFAEAEIDLSKPMTLLIGRNGSGKSNVIEAVELLAEFVKERKVHEISDIGRGGRFEIRGSLAGCFKRGAEYFELGYNDIDFNGECHVKLNLKPTIHIEYNNEIFDDAEFYLVELNNCFGRYNNVFAFDIYPRIMRQYSPIGLMQLSRNGENISSVLPFFII